MSWAFSVALPADPAGCVAAAATLRSAADAAAAAADFHAGQARVPRSAFSGCTAQAYRSAAAALHLDARSVSERTGALAVALEAYAAAIGDVRRVLARVRDDALAAGFVVTADDQVLWPPSPVADVNRRFDRLEAAAVAAHARTDAACAAWWRAVQEHTRGRLPSRL